MLGKYIPRQGSTAVSYLKNYTTESKQTWLKCLARRTTRELDCSLNGGCISVWRFISQPIEILKWKLSFPWLITSKFMLIKWLAFEFITPMERKPFARLFLYNSDKLMKTFVIRNWAVCMRSQYTLKQYVLKLTEKRVRMGEESSRNKAGIESQLIKPDLIGLSDKPKTLSTVATTFLVLMFPEWIVFSW